MNKYIVTKEGTNNCERIYSEETVTAENPRAALKKTGYGWKTRAIRGEIKNGTTIQTSRYIIVTVREQKINSTGE